MVTFRGFTKPNWFYGCDFYAELWCKHLSAAACCFLLGGTRGPENGPHKTWFELKIFRNLPLDWSNLYLLFSQSFCFPSP